jgi:hypothetical protein
MQRNPTMTRHAPFRAAAVLAAVFVLAAGSASAGGPRRACSLSALALVKSCRFQAQADYWLELAKCENIEGRSERVACRQEAQAALKQAYGDCNDEYDGRRETCEDLGEAPHAPEIDPKDFASEVTNPFFPLKPGTTYVFEATTKNGVEHDEVHVTHRTKTILGVRCVEVRDTVTVSDQVTEDTFDWFAQDKTGNVWYFGEHSESFEDGVLVSLEGSWEAGVDGALPGIIMEAEPRVDDVYRQEFSPGTAEDIAEVVALGQKVSVPFGTFEGCLKTEESAAPSPDQIENKYYAPGIGVVLEVDLEDGERLELIDVIHE